MVSRQALGPAAAKIEPGELRGTAPDVEHQRAGGALLVLGGAVLAELLLRLRLGGSPYSFGLDRGVGADRGRRLLGRGSQAGGFVTRLGPDALGFGERASPASVGFFACRDLRLHPGGGHDAIALGQRVVADVLSLGATTARLGPRLRQELAGLGFRFAAYPAGVGVGLRQQLGQGEPEPDGRPPPRAPEHDVAEREAREEDEHHDDARAHRLVGRQPGPAGEVDRADRAEDGADQPEEDPEEQLGLLGSSEAAERDLADDLGEELAHDWRRGAVAGVGNSSGSTGTSMMAGLPAPSAAFITSPTWSGCST